jgi:hypothetical protein
MAEFRLCGGQITNMTKKAADGCPQAVKNPES